MSQYNKNIDLEEKTDKCNITLVTEITLKFIGSPMSDFVRNG